MPDITNVDLLWQRKARGVSPLGRYALTDDGLLVASVPDELEPRTRHIARFDTSGRSQIVETYTVETLRKTEIGMSGTVFAGITDDDLYLFQSGRKSRFLPDRRASYTDLALGGEGQRFGAALCDMLLSGNAIALGDISGRVLWTKDIAFAVTRIAVDREAAHLAIAGEAGDLLLLDAARNTLISHRQEAPLTAVATLGPERTVFAGGGGVGAVDPEGHLLWFTPIPGDLFEIALDAAGRTIAVLIRQDEGTGRLVFLSTDGLPTWDLDFDESRPTGLSLSPDGRNAAVSLRDGTLAVYRLEYGERLHAAAAEQVLAEAQAARDGGSLRQAADLLRARLQAVPTDTLAGDALRDVLRLLRERSLAAAETAEAVGDFAAADAHLSEIITTAPLDADAVARRAAVRARWAERAREAGVAALAQDCGAEAEARFLEAIEADPLDNRARAALAEARSSASAEALARGRELLQSGQFSEAIAALAEAQAHGASGPDVADLLKQARVGEALALGNQLYADRQYAAALFQFKKALRLDPANVDAAQKVSYAQNFLQDTQLNDRFTRLE